MWPPPSPLPLPLLLMPRCIVASLIALSFGTSSSHLALALPVSNKAVNPNAAASASSASTAAPLSTKADSSLKQLKQSLLRKFHDGAKKINAVLTAAAPLLGMESQPLKLEAEAAKMSKWWCAMPEKATTTLCERRASYEKLKSLSGEARKAEAAKAKALAAKNATESVLRKAMHEEAKAMVTSFCKTDEGQDMQLCIRSMSLLDRAKHFVQHLRKVHQGHLGGAVPGAKLPIRQL